MATWDYWHSELLVHVPGAPNPLIAQSLRKAAREFFKRTRAWNEWLDPLTTVNQLGYEYDFELPCESELIRIEQATLNSNPLNIEPYRQVTSDWTKNVIGGGALISKDLLSFNLSGYPVAKNKVQVQVSLRPSKTATGIPDHLADRYLEELSSGAKSLLMLVPGTSFFNPDLAIVARNEFDAGMASASVNSYRGHTNVVPRAQPKWC